MGVPIGSARDLVQGAPPALRGGRPLGGVRLGPGVDAAVVGAVALLVAAGLGLRARTRPAG